MCVMSLVVDHYKEKLRPYTYPYPASVPQPYTDPFVVKQYYPISNPPSREEFNKLIKMVDEMKEAMAAAKKVDELTNQPNCESTEKIAAIKAMLEALNIDPRDLFD